MCQGGVFGHVSFIDRSSVSRSGRIPLNERNWENRQLTDTMRMPLLKGNAISIRSVLFSCKKLDFVEDIAKGSFLFVFVSALKQV